MTLLLLLLIPAIYIQGAVLRGVRRAWRRQADMDSVKDKEMRTHCCQQCYNASSAQTSDNNNNNNGPVAQYKHCTHIL